MAENKPKEQRYIEILEAAARCFAKNGYLGTSVNDICKEAGLTKGGLYWHFPSKKHILEALLDFFCDRWQGEWKRLEGIQLDDNTLYEAGLIFIRNNIANPDKVRLNVMLETEAIRDAGLSEVMTASRKLLMQDITRFSERILAHYGNTAINAAQLARILNIQVTGIVMQAVLYETDLDVEALWSASVSLLRKGILE